MKPLAFRVDGLAGGACVLGPRPGIARGFTLMELLVVIAIIGILTAVALPSMKNIGKSNAMASANSQIIDDLNYARQTAIAKRTPVHVVFVPPNFLVTPANQANSNLASRLQSGVYTTYAIYAERMVGDQPGEPHPRYLRGGDWKTLPDGVFIQPDKFTILSAVAWNAAPPSTNRPFKFSLFPFPTATGPLTLLPHVTFSPTGSLIAYDATDTPKPNPEDEYILLSRGSILAVRDNAGVLIEYDVRESPPRDAPNYVRNVLHIDGFTGRARLERPEIQ